MTTNLQRCVQCTRFTMRLSSAMAKLGYGNCDKAKPWQFESATFPRVCEKFDQADDELVAQRLEWLQKQRGSTA